MRAANTSLIRARSRHMASVVIAGPKWDASTAHVKIVATDASKPAQWGGFHFSGTCAFCRPS